MFLLLALAPVTTAFFFGGSSCGCSAPPACPPPPPPPVCAPVQPACPPQPSCGYSGVSYGQPSYQPQVISAAVPSAQTFQAAPVVQSYQSAPAVQTFQASPVVANTFQAAPASGSYVGPVAGPAQVQVQPVSTGSYQSAPAPAASSRGVVETVVELPQQTVEVQVQEAQPAVVSQGSSYQPNAEVSSVQNAQAIQVEEVQVPANPSYNEVPGAVAAASKNAEVIEEPSSDDGNKRKSEGKTPKTKGEEKKETSDDHLVDVASLKLSDDPLCNSDDLRKLMLENMDENLNSSKRLIQLAAEAQFGGRFDVICANGDFSYVTNTELWCQETKGDVSCYTYRQL